MLVRILAADDKRMAMITDILIEMVDEKERTMSSKWVYDTTIASLYYSLHKQYKGNLEACVLDYGDELQGIVTATADNGTVNYRMTILNL